MLGRLESMSIRAILLDVDGTLADSTEVILRGLRESYQNFLGHSPADDEIRGLIGRPLFDQMNLFGLEHHPSSLSERMDFAIRRFAAHQHLAKLFVEPVEAAVKLHLAGFPVAMVTSKNRLEIEEFWSVAPMLRPIPVVTADDAARPKPFAEPALLACQILGVDPAEAVMIGDSIYDIRCGKSAGTATIAVTYGAGRLADLDAEAPDTIFTHPTALASWLEAQQSETHAKEKDRQPC